MNFVLLAPRRGDRVVAAEYSDFLTFSGLAPTELEVRVLDRPDSSIGTLDGVDGVFIGGSPFTLTDPVDDVWQPAISAALTAFVEQELARGTLPIFAACFGSSLFAHHFGGSVGKQYSEEAGAATVQQTAAAASDPLCAGLPDRFTVLSGHKDSVASLPDSATLLLTGERCPVQMYRLGDNVWASQFHPEMDDERIRTRLSFYENDGYVRPGHQAAAYAQLTGHDTTAANSLLRRFVTHARQRASNPAA